MEKTYSQKVARVFEIVCYMLLVPAILSLIYPAVGVVGALLSGRGETFFICLIPFGIAGVGIFLLVGYSRHARGVLDENHVSTLWIATAVYNFLLLLPWFWAVAAYLKSPGRFVYNGNRMGFLISISIISAYLAAIYFSVKAYTLEKFIRI